MRDKRERERESVRDKRERVCGHDSKPWNAGMVKGYAL